MEMAVLFVIKFDALMRLVEEIVSYVARQRFLFFMLSNVNSLFKH